MRSQVEGERRRRELSRPRAEDDGLTVLQRVLEHGADPRPLVESFDAFRARVRPAAQPLVSIRAAGPVDLAQGARGASVLEFGPGTFRLDPREPEWRPLAGGTRSFEVRGAGIDATTLVAGHQWAFLATREGTRVDVVVRDLTFDGRETGGSLLDVRGDCAVILENVRVLGWVAAGHAAAIGVSGHAYLGARGCEFVDRRPAGGWAVSLHGDSVALLEECRFLGLERGALIASGKDVKRGHATLRGCVFEDARLSDRTLDTPTRVVGGSVRYGDVSLPEDKRRREWGEGYAEVRGVVFAPSDTRLTLGALLDALDRLRLPDDPQVVGIAVEDVVGGVPVAFRVHALGPGKRTADTYLLDARGSIRRLEHAAPPGLPPPDVVRLAGPLAKALRTAGVPEDLRTGSLALSWMGGDDAFPTIHVGRWIVDARDGKVVRAPR